MPGSGSCSNGVARHCREDGSGYDRFECDPVQGMRCEPGGCRGVCAPPEISKSYVGCDYYPTVTANPVWEGFDYAVAISNASTLPAHVTITRGDTAIKELDIGVGSLETVKLPWVEQLKATGIDPARACPAEILPPGSSQLARKGAYRVRSDQPVTVYQLSPLQYELVPAPSGCPVASDCPGAVGATSACLSYSNDASLLLPATSLTANYDIISWPALNEGAAFISVTATADDTTVEVNGGARFSPGGGIDARGHGRVSMQRGDVLQILSEHTGPNLQFLDDPTGTKLRASKPVQVIVGHSCARVPTADTRDCDHLEEALFPVETLGKEYVVTYPAAPASESPHVIRVLAVQQDTELTFEPPLVAATKISPGDPPLELREVTEDVRITSDKPILVAQYMQGLSSVRSGAGDPSMSLVVASEQFRKDYIFVASKTYDVNFINVVARQGTRVVLDGQPLPSHGFRPIGQTGFAVLRHELPAGGSDVHRIRAESEFGLLVYGYGRFTSYMYPGGLDLKRITPPPLL